MPNRQVRYGGATGALGLVLLWVVGQLGLEMDPETAYAFATLITLGGAWVGKEADGK